MNSFEQLPEGKIAETRVGKSHTEKVLGVVWNMVSDTLIYDMQLDFAQGKGTQF